jgi:hypothetical protein
MVNPPPSIDKARRIVHRFAFALSASTSGAKNRAYPTAIRDTRAVSGDSLHGTVMPEGAFQIVPGRRSSQASAIPVDKVALIRCNAMAFQNNQPAVRECS